MRWCLYFSGRVGFLTEVGTLRVGRHRVVIGQSLIVRSPLRMTITGDFLGLTSRVWHDGEHLLVTPPHPSAQFTNCHAYGTGTPVPLCHWQLRDLVSFGRHEAELFAVHGQSVVTYRLESPTRDLSARSSVGEPESSAVQSTAMDMGFSASCMTFRDSEPGRPGGGFLAAGGQSGEVIQILR